MGNRVRRAAAGLVVVLTCGVAWGVGEAGPAGAEPEIAVGGREFAVDLYQHLRQEDGNLFFSPLSIRTALGMTYAGARTRTADEMAAVLRLPRDQKEAHAALAKLLADLERA